ncbi:MAG: hypothetical protein K2Y32_15400 [Candidatus Obscuribacterales bacterium]|nr:hypothetical protein [Candidatus Obscuribacterales bacterium]
MPKEDEIARGEAKSESAQSSAGDLHGDLVHKDNKLVQNFWQQGREVAKQALTALDDALRPLGSILRAHDEDVLKGPGWTNVALDKEGPSVHRLLAAKPADSYNCKYYVKACIEGRLPSGDGRHEEIDASYLSAHGYKQVEKGRFEAGDVVLVVNKTGLSPSVYAHAAFVESVSPGSGNIKTLVQKPDAVHPVMRSDLKAFAAAYGVTGSQDGKSNFLIVFRKGK